MLGSPFSLTGHTFSVAHVFDHCYFLWDRYGMCPSCYSALLYNNFSSNNPNEDDCSSETNQCFRLFQIISLLLWDQKCM